MIGSHLAELSVIYPSKSFINLPPLIVDLVAITRGIDNVKPQLNAVLNNN